MCNLDSVVFQNFLLQCNGFLKKMVNIFYNLYYSDRVVVIRGWAPTKPVKNPRSGYGPIDSKLENLKRHLMITENTMYKI